MSIIQQHTSATLSDAWRTINIDALTEDSSLNFDTSTLHPPQPEVSEAEVRQLAGQIRQLLRGGDAEGAMRGCLETPVYNGTDAAKVRGPLELLPGSRDRRGSGRNYRQHLLTKPRGPIGGTFANNCRSSPVHQGQ